ncbi:MAG: hypothetical protein CL908_03920 [Deltaproteobacteria bacterium]|nr:hypothetical protein [Deltaproteobacteria bacterium]
MADERTKLEQLRRWRQAAVWAPVFWLPGVVYGLLVDAIALAMMLGFAGLVFALVARGVVWFGRCPRCGARFSETPSGFRRIWDESSCGACGVCLFELRRASEGSPNSALRRGATRGGGEEEERR